MEALLALTKEETQEFANGFLNSGLISLRSNRQKCNLANKQSARAGNDDCRAEKPSRMTLEQQLGLLTGRSMLSQNLTDRCNAFLNEKIKRGVAHEDKAFPEQFRSAEVGNLYQAGAGAGQSVLIMSDALPESRSNGRDQQEEEAAKQRIATVEEDDSEGDLADDDRDSPKALSSQPIAYQTKSKDNVERISREMLRSSNQNSPRLSTV